MGWPTGASQFHYQQQQQFSVLQHIEALLELTQPPAEWVTGVILLWVRWLGHETDHSPSFSAKVNNEWSYKPLLPLYTFTAHMVTTLPSLICIFQLISTGILNSIK